MTRIELLGKFPELNSADSEYVDGLVEYYTSLEYLVTDGGRNLEFNNKDKFHAVGVMSSIFREARNSIKIFTGSLKGDICDHDDYIRDLESAINMGIPIEIVFENDPNKDSICYKKLVEFREKGKNVIFYKLNDEYKANLKSKNISIGHFLISDGRMLRYEEDGELYKAFCNFDDKKLTKLLERNHEILLLNSKVIN